MTHKMRWMAIVVALMVGAAACGGSDDTDATEAGAETTEEQSADEQTAATSADSDSDGGADDGTDSDGAASDESANADDSGDGSQASSESGNADAGASAEEIAELLFPTLDENSLADQQSQFENQERERQQLIAECMTGQGFEYVPVNTGDQVVFGTDEGIDPESREWVETYGFGYTTFTFDEGVEDEAVEIADPNQEYVDGLSESAREAYYEALYGIPPEIDPNLSDEEFNQLLEEQPELFEPQGCDGEAYRATNSFEQIDEVYDALGAQFDELYERLEADPRIAALEQEWAECMAGKGHAYADMDAMYDELSERANALWNPAGFVDPFEGLSDDEIANLLDTSTEEELDELFAGAEPDPEAVAEAQAWEIALALDSFDCGGSTHWQTWQEVLAELQETFIDDNLAAIQAALAGNG